MAGHTSAQALPAVAHAALRGIARWRSVERAAERALGAR
jgi:hypothetical protein